MYNIAQISVSANRSRQGRGKTLRAGISGLILLSYLVPLLAMLAIPAPANAKEASLFEDLRAGICSQRRPASEDPDQDSKYNGARSTCVLCKHPAAPAPDGLTHRVWLTLDWTPVRPLRPTDDILAGDLADYRTLPPRGPPRLSA
ncbi:MAG TPA: hypothetical protein DCG48_09560 [Rhodospirillaceae bacterium]|nr:hypothetical protein [Rhodospirillaceae bacterium]|tara:strand:+ start:2157 stop:2591 length:435 start_codon:yes stop_codon:yes gene_type:complete